MEFSQWLKKYWDQHFCASEPYDAVARRAAEDLISPISVPAAAVTRKAPLSVVTSATSRPVARSAAATQPASTMSSSKGPTVAMKQSSASSSPAKPSGTSPEDLQMMIKLKKAVAELKDSSIKMQEERDFYFGKLRQIEVLTQEEVAILDKEALVAKIQSILYAPLNDC